MKLNSVCNNILIVQFLCLFLCLVFMKVVGGEITPAAALAPKCGPIGLPPKKVGEDIQKATTKWKGIKI